MVHNRAISSVSVVGKAGLNIERQEKSRLPTKSKDFCYEHIISTFSDDPLQICPSKDDRIQCWGARHSKNMALCKLWGLALRPNEMTGAFPTDIDSRAMSNFTANLIGSTSCLGGSVRQLEERSRSPVPTKFMKHIINSPRLGESQCTKWIEKPAFLHVSNAVHIYFKLLDLYNVHKAAYDEGLSDGEFVVVRIGNLMNDRLNYMHAEFEERLFGRSDLDLIQMSKEGIGTVCFRQAVVVPNAYASVPFRCKMESNTRKKCIDCAGPKHEAHPMITFSDRVRATCGLEKIPQDSNKTFVTVISRKPYTRWKGDEAGKNFHRVLDNEDQLMDALQSARKDLGLQVELIHLETMEICDQIGKAASSDILIGVHGAGLVHLWWLVKKHATLIELEPGSQVNNPSFRKVKCPTREDGISICNPSFFFRTLAALTGREYVAVRATAAMGQPNMGTEPVHVEPSRVLDEVRKIVDAKRRDQQL